MKLQRRRRWRDIAVNGMATVVFALLLGSVFHVLGVVDLLAPWRSKIPGDAVPVLVSSRFIRRYARVMREDVSKPDGSELSIMWLPRSSAPPNALNDINAVVGRVMRQDKPPGYVFTEKDLFPVGTRPGTVAAIPPGLRSLRLAADQITGIHGLLPGDRFDLVATRQVDISAVPNWQSVTGPAATQITVQAQLQNLLKQAAVEVISQNSMILEPLEVRDKIERSTSATKGTTTKTVQVQEVVIAVTPEEVARVMQAAATGESITCVPRSGQPNVLTDRKTIGLSPRNPMGAVGINAAPDGWTMVENVNGGEQKFIMTPRSR